MIARRKFLLGLGAALVAAPAVIRTPGLLMPIRPFVTVKRFVRVEDWLNGLGRDEKIDGLVWGDQQQMLDYPPADLMKTGRIIRRMGPYEIIRFGMEARV